jgi:hypothetical protein
MTSLKLGTKNKVIKLEPKEKAVAKLVDELGEINEQRKQLEKREAELKTTLYTYGPGVYSGKYFDAMSTEMKRTFYKTELLMTHVSEDILKKCEVVTPYLKVSVQRKANLT